MRHLVKDCGILSQYHAGLSYQEAFDLTPFEKQLIAEVIEEDQEREMKIRSAMFGMKKV